MTDKNGIEPVPIAAITPATPKDVSVTLTGVAAKAEAGSFTPSLSVPLGVAARGEAGSFTPSLPAEDRYVGSTIPFPPNTGSPPAEAEGEYVAHAVEFGPGLEGGIADAGVVGGFAISPDAGELNLNGEAPDVFNAEVTVGGEGSLKADAQVVSPSRVVEAVGLAAGRGQETFDLRLSERPADIRDATRILAAAVKDQIETLKRSPPRGVNDLEKYDDFINFLEKLAAGLNELANALDRLVEAKAKGSSEPIFTDKAREIARELVVYVTKFAEDHPYIADFSMKIGLSAAAFNFLLHIGGFADQTAAATVIAAILASKKDK